MKKSKLLPILLGASACILAASATLAQNNVGTVGSPVLDNIYIYDKAGTLVAHSAFEGNVSASKIVQMSVGPDERYQNIAGKACSRMEVTADESGRAEISWTAPADGNTMTLEYDQHTVILCAGELPNDGVR